MPLTPFQREVFAVLRRSRTPERYVMGATVLNQADATPRFSEDIDLCHDVATAVAETAALDESALVAAGYEVSWQLRQPMFQRGTVRRQSDSVKLEWVYDSAFRFYPVEADDELGWRLHYADAATNKVLALASRAEPRDFVDALHLHANYLSLGSLAWAAAGKDEGLNPKLILDLVERFARYRQSDIDALHLAEPLDLSHLKSQWQIALEEGRTLINQLPAVEIGCLYLDPVSQQPQTPNPLSDSFAGLIRHRGTVGGAWPRIIQE
jgi:hypothetical protein